LAPGTQWSQRPIDSLPAACAVRTNGVAIMLADAAVAMNRRRVSALLFLLIIAFLPCFLPGRGSTASGWPNCRAGSRAGKGRLRPLAGASKSLSGGPALRPGPRQGRRGDGTRVRHTPLPPRRPAGISGDS
jgi:hypothetical protein